MRFSLLMLVAVFGCFASAADDNARLLASKSILNTYLVEGKDLTVEYNIYNVGGSAATSVHLVDGSFPDTDFEGVLGSLDVKWARIAPSSNVSHVVIVRPLKSGYFNFTSAEISYLPTEQATQPQLAYTSAPGEGGIINYKDYDRKFSPHVLDWAAFGVMTLPSLGIPFLLWCGSKSKYEEIMSSKSK